MNPIVVHKYGGSSLSTLDKIRAVAARIASTVDDGKRVVAVVSAMGGTTDELLSKAKGLSANPQARELDMLLSVGERISTSLLAIALEELGQPAVSFTGSQAGIITNARHNRARIIEVRCFRVMDELDAGKVVIVAGYQGVSYSREITTLGRGGTDTTAVAMAAALDAEYCEICSDVDGVYTADPRVVSDAKRLDALDHGEMLALARHGSRVLNQDCVQFAARRGVAIFAKATFGPKDDKGTVVRVNPTREPRPVTGIAHRNQVAEVTLRTPDKLTEMLRAMSARGAYPVTLQRGHDGVRAAFGLDDTHGYASLMAELDDRFGGALSTRDDRGTVTVVGQGLGEEPEALQTALVIANDIAPDGEIQLGPLDLTVTLPGSAVQTAVRRLHAALCSDP